MAGLPSHGGIRKGGKHRDVGSCEAAALVTKPPGATPSVMTPVCNARFETAECV